MKRLLLAAALCVASPAVNAQTALEFAAAGMGQPTAKPVRSYGRSRSVEPRGSVQNMIAAHVSSRIGSQWVGTALRIAKIESGYRCNARNGRAVGIFQNTNPAMFGVSAPLAAKAREIESACGSRVISGVRHTRVAGSRRWSLHASGRAVDMTGNPGCIYARLRGWSGGYSTDYARVHHVHISLGGREDGIRFAHRSGRMRIAWR